MEWVLFSGLIALVMMALLALDMSANYTHQELWQKQATFMAFGTLGFALLCFVPLQTIERMSWPIYGLALVLLVLVIFFGDEYRGAIRHFDLGVVDFHPADLMQWALMFALAWWFSNRETKGVLGMMIPLSLAMMPMVVLFVLPDLGKIMLLVLIAMAMMIMAKQWRLLVSTLVGGTVFISLCWHFMHAYQKNRILIFFDSENSVADYGLHFDSHFNYEAGYGLLQSDLAGLPGSLVTIFAWVVVAVLIYRLFRVVYHAQSRFTFMLSATISLMFALYVILNAAILSGYLHAIQLMRPPTAYNELSLVFMMAAMGIVMRVAIESKESSAKDDSGRVAG